MKRGFQTGVSNNETSAAILYSPAAIATQPSRKATDIPRNEARPADFKVYDADLGKSASGQTSTLAKVEPPDRRHRPAVAACLAPATTDSIGQISVRHWLPAPAETPTWLKFAANLLTVGPTDPAAALRPQELPRWLDRLPKAGPFHRKTHFATANLRPVRRSSVAQP